MAQLPGPLRTRKSTAVPPAPAGDTHSRSYDLPDIPELPARILPATGPTVPKPHAAPAAIPSAAAAAAATAAEAALLLFLLLFRVAELLPTPPPSTATTLPPRLGPEEGLEATGSGDPIKTKVAATAEEEAAREMRTGAAPDERASGASHVA